MHDLFTVQSGSRGNPSFRAEQSPGRGQFEGITLRCYNFKELSAQKVFPGPTEALARAISQSCNLGQVAQLVERSPEKAGVGGSIPSLATIIPKDLNDFTDFLQPKVQPKIRH